MVLMKKYERVVSEKSASFVECLSAMAVNGEESTILEYTSQWVSKVNQGGIVELWLTIRGFSIAGQWMEIYKKCSSRTTKKSKSLRKTLKQGTDHADE